MGFFGRADDGAGKSGSRGQSEVLGIVLLLSITVVGATTISVLGAAVIDDARQDVSEGNAEHAMTQLDSKASLVAFDSSNRKDIAVSSGSDATTRVDPDAGNINITIDREDAPNLTVVDDEPLGAIVQEGDDSTIAYQGGGVWMRSDDHVEMISPPEFHYRINSRGDSDDPTLTLPLVMVRGEETAGDSVSMTQGEQTAHFPDPSNGSLSNPMAGGVVYMEIESEYAQGWASFFEQRTEGEVSDSGDDWVRIRLVIPEPDPVTDVDGPMLSSASGETLTIPNNAEVDGYNSTEGEYTGGDSSALIGILGDLEIENNAVVEGSVVASEDSTVYVDQPNSELDGKVYCAGSGTDCVTDPSKTNGVESGGYVPSASAIDTEDIVEDYETDNDNDDSNGIIDNDEFVNGGTLDSGEYYVTDMSIDDELTLDASSENITIAVDGDVEINDRIEVTNGDGIVRIYVAGDDAMVRNNVEIPGDQSPRLWVYGNGLSMTFENDVEFAGAIYDPGGDGVVFSNNAVLYGGVISPVDDIGQNAEIHFDEALLNAPPIDEDNDSEVPRVTYLHVTTNEINATAT